MAGKKPLINGREYDFSSIEATIKGQKFENFLSSISYGQSLDGALVMGNHSQPRGKTRGSLETEASMDVFKADWYDILAALGNGYMEVDFDITVTYGDNGQRVKNDRLVGCNISGHNDDHSQGSDALVVSCDLLLNHIVIDGKTPLKRMLGGSTPSTPASTVPGV